MASVSDIAQSTGMRTYEEYKESTRAGGKTLGKNDFLQLLAAQMQYQNPLEPTKDTDFIAQLAQFSSLEQMESLNTTMSSFQYYSFAGKFVAADTKLEDGREGTIFGVVDSIFSKTGTSYAELGECYFVDKDGVSEKLSGGYVVKASTINQVYDSNLINPAANGKTPTLLEAATLIGRTVTAKIDVNIEVAEGEEAKVEQREITGVVSRVAMTDAGITAYLDDGQEVLISNIVDIQQ